MKKGFSLIETLIAVTILSLSVAGPLFTASRAIVAAQISRDQLTASYLAQEGIEYVRMMRDNAFLSAYDVGGASVSTVGWNNFTTGSGDASIASCVLSACTLDPARPMGTGALKALFPCSGGTCTPLYLNGGIYTQLTTGGTKTAFTRTVQATTTPATTAELITSTVQWNFHEVVHTVTVTDYLTPWQ